MMRIATTQPSPGMTGESATVWTNAAGHTLTLMQWCLLIAGMLQSPWCWQGDISRRASALQAEAVRLRDRRDMSDEERLTLLTER